MRTARYEIGNRVMYRCGKFQSPGVVESFDDHPWGRFYKVKLDDGSIVLVGWNNLKPMVDISEGGIHGAAKPAASG